MLDVRQADFVPSSFTNTLLKRVQNAKTISSNANNFVFWYHFYDIYDKNFSRINKVLVLWSYTMTVLKSWLELFPTLSRKNFKLKPFHSSGWRRSYYYMFLLGFVSALVHWINCLPTPAFTCSKLTIETLEQDVKYIQS